MKNCGYKKAVVVYEVRGPAHGELPVFPFPPTYRYAERIRDLFFATLQRNPTFGDEENN
jgi:hypothetical protein